MLTNVSLAEGIEPVVRALLLLQPHHMHCSVGILLDVVADIVYTTQHAIKCVTR